VVKERAGEGVDTVYSSVSYDLSANVDNLVLTGTATNGTGNALDNHLIGNSANNVLEGGAGADILDGQSGTDTLWGGNGNDLLIGGNGADTLIGDLGKDSYNLTETTAATDTLRIAKGDSLVSSYDVAQSFKLGTGVVRTAGIDRLDLASTIIAANAAAVNGVDSGIIHSHHISNGIISFDDVNSYSTPLAVAATNLADVFGYLQANITGQKTVAFVSEGNTFVFQDGGGADRATDTLVELLGVTATSLSTTGIADHSVWIV
jgi:Ca2+-binding RTX toxin-like protein